MEIRDVFFERIYQLLCSGEDIYVVTADLLGGEFLGKIKQDFPQHYVSVGIAEQNLILVGAGLSTQGKKTICWGMNPFIIARTLDQIDNTVSLMKLPLTLVGFHAGLSFAATGPSHAGTRDISRIRTCSFVKCINPMDYSTVRDSVEDFLAQKQGLYIRLDKDIVWENVPGSENVRIGDGVCLLHKGSSPFSIITTGYHSKVCMELIPQLQKKGIDPSIVSLLSFPFAPERLVELTKSSKKCATVEESILQGGMSSEVIEAFVDCRIQKDVHRIGIDAIKGHPSFFGYRKDLQMALGLDEQGILNELFSFFR